MDPSVSRYARRLTVHYALIQGLYYSTYASLFAYLVVFLTGRGLNPSQIGFITALRVGAALVGSFTLAHLVDTRERISLKYLFMILCAVGTVFCLLFPLSRGKVVFTALLLLGMGCTSCALDAILSGLALQFINAGIPVGFSVARSVGSVAYAVVCIISGRMVDRFGTEVVIWIYVVAMALLLVVLAAFPRFRNESEAPGSADEAGAPANASAAAETAAPVISRSKGAGNPIALLRENRPFRLLIVSTVILCFGYVPLSGFLSTFLTNVGADNSTIGLAFFIAAFSEMPMMAFIFPHLVRRKVPVEKLLFAASVFHFFRYFSYAFLTVPWMFVAVQVLQMVSYGLATPAAVYYINANVSKENRMTGQTIYTFSGNIGSTFGNPVFGVVLDHWGTQAMALGGSAFILLSLIPMGRLVKGAKRGRK